MSIEVESSDVIRLCLQFLREHGLEISLQTLLEESKVTWNSVGDAQGLASAVRQGHWDHVMQLLGASQLPFPLLADIYHQMCLELIESGEKELCTQIISESAVMKAMRTEQKERFARLYHLLSQPAFHPREAYLGGLSKEKIRETLAQEILYQLAEVDAGRVDALIHEAAKWQRHHGLLPPGEDLHVCGTTSAQRWEGEDMTPSTPGKSIKFGKSSWPTAAVCSPDGQHIITGNEEGFVEVWNMNGKLDLTLPFQAQEQCMMHASMVTDLAISRDSSRLVSGSADGEIRVWSVETGQCLLVLAQVHPQGVGCVDISRDGVHIASGGKDGVACLWSVQSGKRMAFLEGHGGPVTACVIQHEPNRMMTGGQDGTVRLWDTRSCEIVGLWCMQNQTGLRCEPSSWIIKGDAPIRSIVRLDVAVGEFLVIVDASLAFVISGGGRTLRTLRNDDGDVHFVDGVESAHGSHLYVITKDGYLQAFSALEGVLCKSVHVVEDEAEVVGLIRHPHNGMIGVQTKTRRLRLWKPVKKE